VEEHQPTWPVQVLCDVLEVSRSGYYAWRRSEESARSQRAKGLVAQMRVIHGEPHKQNYGSPRMQEELAARGHRVSENTVARLMRANGLRAATARKFRHTTDSNHGQAVAENVLNRQFDQERPNQAWVSDITYVPTREGWLYLACVLDLHSRSVVGWSMSRRLKSDVVLAAVGMAVQRRRPGPGLVHHSDRGSQYTGGEFQQFLQTHGIVCSMSRKGNCYDNAVMESFFGTLKKELVHQADYSTGDAARQAIFEYIEVFYNRVRRHSALGNVSPATFEHQAA
jgi:transposase InsO family protein